MGDAVGVGNRQWMDSGVLKTGLFFEDLQDLWVQTRRI